MTNKIVKLPVKKRAVILKPLKNGRIDLIYDRIVTHIDLARVRISSSVNTEMVQTYWLIGKEIVEEEQGGKNRAKYGDELIKTLSKRLTSKFGRGFTVRSLQKIREFYLVYKDGPKTALIAVNGKNRKAPALRALSRKSDKNQEKWQLSWTHYRLLTTIDNHFKRSFYETEAIKNRWSSRELDRQIGSLLYDRLAKSKDKIGLMQLSLKGQEISKPEDAIKDPLVLEFLNVPESLGLVLCAEKDDAMVKYTLGEKQKRIFASRYQLYLPSEQELAEEIRKELKNLKRKGSR